MAVLNKILKIKNDKIGAIIKHFPHWLTPNLLTWLRLALLPLIIFFIFQDKYLFSLVIFIFAFSLDIFDGPLARRRGLVSDFGALLDPFVDKTVFLTTLFLVGYQTLPHAMLYVILGLEIIVIIIAGLLAPLARKLNYRVKIGANQYGKYKMFFQFIGLVVLMIDPSSQALIQAGVSIFVVAIIFSAMSNVDHLRNFTWEKKRL
jgi:CDP-diacylglycerol--glycerol-3-phosphate 3-phosphatidyltransferase